MYKNMIFGHTLQVHVHVQSQSRLPYPVTLRLVSLSEYTFLSIAAILRDCVVFLCYAQLELNCLTMCMFVRVLIFFAMIFTSPHFDPPPPPTPCRVESMNLDLGI